MDWREQNMFVLIKYIAGKFVLQELLFIGPMERRNEI